ncbi:MAG: glycosyltransferase [Chloroflexi bacterium]|nr:glycosyltransferase [Chloroflexota bacterium]
MLQAIETQPKSLKDYAPLVGEEIIAEIHTLAADLKGARVLHINSTPYGGGVAEILHTLLPLMRDVGLDAHWQVIRAELQFFEVTKAFHNALQGMPLELSEEIIDIYNRNNQANAENLEDDFEFIVVHDPQPAALLHFHGRHNNARWIWRCHIDTSTPNQQVWNFLRPTYLDLYDAAVFTLERFAHPDLRVPKIAAFPPSIDPLSPKNLPMRKEEAKAIVARYGVDITRPLLVQVSRFDPWKDPLGVIEAYRRVKKKMPEVQLALVGAMAADDPEGVRLYARALRRAGDDFDIDVVSNWDGVHDREVNAFQTAADVVIQKSVREGFGLTVTEALWKGKPVIGGNAGGIPLQVIEGETGFLVESEKECALRALALLQNPDLALKMGHKAKEHVRQNFLSPRHLRDYLRLFRELK